jgi:hypothetical protein
MKINELLSAQQELDEGFGDFVGRAAGNVAGAVGAAGRGLKGAWDDAKAGYAAAKSGWDPKDGTEPTAAPGTAPTAAVPGAPAAAPAPQSGSAPGRPYVAPAPAAARTAPGAGTTAPAPKNAGNIGDIIKMIDTLDQPSKQQLAGELEKNIAATPKPEAPAPAAPTAAPTAPAAVKPAATAPKGFTVPGAVTPTNVKYSGLAKSGAQPGPTQAELDADQARMATGTNESKVFRSNFLGIDL